MEHTTPRGCADITMTSLDDEDCDPVSAIDRAIVYAIESPELDPRIRDAFINALLDKRNKATLGA